jgi:predicted alpha/beta hydrolase family esterase
MTSQVLFIQGAGEGAYVADLLLAQNLQKELGPDFNVRYPEMADEANAPYDLWKQQIQDEIAMMGESVILVGHSMGASEMAKILTEIKVDARISGIYLLASPFWGGEGWLYEGYEELELPVDAAAKFPNDAKIFLYHTRDDEIVPFDHLALYATAFPQATIREIDSGGHQFNGDLSVVAQDIKTSNV